MDFSALDGHQDMLSPGSADVALLRASAVQLLTQIDERENLLTQKVIPLPAGMWNALFRLEPAGLVVKLSSGDNDFEVNFLRQAAALDLPVPQILSAGRLEYPALPNATYFLMSYVANCANAWAMCDLNLSNVLVDMDTHRLRAILDPAGYAGMPMFDLGYASMPWDHGFEFYEAIIETYRQNSDKFDSDLFYTSILVVAYRHSRFHTPAVRESIFRDILPKIG